MAEYEAGAAPSARTSIDLPQVISFLQQEFRSFELDRNQWRMERSGLQTKIAVLEGEKKGLESLKLDLLRRIKMLEHALKQERSKLGADITPRTSVDSAPLTGERRSKEAYATLPPDFMAKHKSSVDMRAKKSRDILRSYLQEVGLKDVSGLHQYGTLRGSTALETIRETERARMTSPPSTPMGESPAMFDNTPQAASSVPVPVAEPLPAVRVEKAKPEEEESGEPSAEDLAEMEKKMGGRMSRQMKQWDKSAPKKKPLKKKVDGESHANKEPEAPRPSVPVSTPEAEPISADKQPSAENVTVAAPATSPAPKIAVPETKPFISSSRRHRESGADVKLALQSVREHSKDEERLNSSACVDKELGELTDVKVGSPDLGSKRTYKPKFTLRHHLDGVRSLAFLGTNDQPEEPDVKLDGDSKHSVGWGSDGCVSAGEDGTVKVWSFMSIAAASGKKTIQSPDVEPIATMRGHKGPVLCVVPKVDENKLYSGGLDGTVRSWRLPGCDEDPSGPLGTVHSHRLSVMTGHSDAVWELALHPAGSRIMSIAADDTMRIWDTSDDKCIETFSVSSPTSIRIPKTNPEWAVIGTLSGRLAIVDVTTGQVLSLLGEECGQVNKVACHPSMPVAVTAHEDKYIRFWDLRSNDMTHGMVAHLDSVAAIDIHPAGNVIVSGGHDCSLRFWDFAAKSCLQELTVHRPKFNEGIAAVAFHPTRAMVGCAGADSTIKVYNRA